MILPSPQYAPLSYFLSGPLFSSGHFIYIKDPCVVFDGVLWHMFGTGDKGFNIQIFHAVSEASDGGWREVLPTQLHGVEGDVLAAPGIWYDSDEALFHMFIQTDCFALNGRIEHLTSKDGSEFHYSDTSLHSGPGLEEAGIYDPHPAEINERKYLVYSGMSQVGQPDIFLARSITNTWYGPWVKEGCIVSHEHIDHHNQLGHEDYEWGLEGAQLVALPNGLILMNSVCFLPDAPKGQRQRVFFAVSNDIRGPYVSLGPLIKPPKQGWDSAENGHASCLIEEDRLRCYYQARSLDSEFAPWNCALATLNVRDIEMVAYNALTVPKEISVVS